MEKLTRENLYTLEQYAEMRPAFREKVMAHKKNRRVDIGPNFTLYFEDRLTIQYQVQEMLRIEKIFETDGILEELGAYNPLIPDGNNLKCTAMIEFGDVELRKKRLAELVGMEHTVWAKVDGHEKVFAIANEDLERSTDEKTSAVHFMRFEFSREMIQELLAGADLEFGCDHESYPHSVGVPEETCQALAGDFT